MKHRTFITGGSGYMGQRLIPLLLARGHSVTALVRSNSQNKIPAGCEIVVGDALDGDSYRARVSGCDTFIQLVGVSHPSPAKAREFVAVDLKSGQEAIRVASAAGIRHFVYVSVAHPAPVMHAYIEVRAACEESLNQSGLNATILRPWYVLGPGHRWPLLLKPFYWVAERVASSREGALRLGLVAIRQMVNTLASVVEKPASGTRVLEVPDIRRIGNMYQQEVTVGLGSVKTSVSAS